MTFWIDIMQLGILLVLILHSLHLFLSVLLSGILSMIVIYALQEIVKGYDS